MRVARHDWATAQRVSRWGRSGGSPCQAPAPGPRSEASSPNRITRTLTVPSISCTGRVRPFARVLKTRSTSQARSAPQAVRVESAGCPGMAKKVDGEPHIKVLPSGLFFVNLKVSSRNLNLPAVESLETAKGQRDTLVRKRAADASSALAYVRDLKKSRAEEATTRTGARKVVPSGGLFFARVTRRHVVYEGPRRQTSARAAADRDALESATDLERILGVLRRDASPIRDLPQYVYKNRHGKFFAGVNDPFAGTDVNGRLKQVAGPTHETVEEATSQAEVLLDLRKRGLPLQEGAAGFHEEAALTRLSFVEAKGGGWFLVVYRAKTLFVHLCLQLNRTIQKITRGHPPSFRYSIPW